MKSVTATWGAKLGDLTGSWKPTGPTGYSFGGFYGDNTTATASCYITEAGKGSASCPSDMPSTIYARWSKKVTLDKQGGSGGTDEVNYVRGVGFAESSVTKPSAPSGGWFFLGYCDYNPSENPSGSVYQFYTSDGAQSRLK